MLLEAQTYRYNSKQTGSRICFILKWCKIATHWLHKGPQAANNSGVSVNTGDKFVSHDPQIRIIFTNVMLKKEEAYSHPQTNTTECEEIFQLPKG